MQTTGTEAKYLSYYKSQHHSGLEFCIFKAPLTFFLFSLLFFGTLHSDAFIFPFLLCFSLLFFSQLFVRPPQTAILFFAFLFLGDGLDPCLLYKKIRDTKSKFHAKMGSIKDRNCMDLTKQKILRRGGKNIQKNCTKKVFMTQIITMV